MKRLLAVLFAFSLALTLYATTFTDINAGLSGMANGSSVWGDFDTDGDLDILSTGVMTGYPDYQKAAKIYCNNGDGTFTETNACLPGISHGTASPADIDNDGDLDILLTGLIGPYQPVSRIFRNDGNFVFTYVNAGLAGVEDGSTAWGDYDDDGDLDLILSGMVWEENYVTHLYRNEGNFTFASVDTEIEGLGSGSSAWADYDGDGDADLLLCGWNYRSYLTAIYCNEGDGTFSDLRLSATGVYRGSSAWGDYDNDGDLDVLASGFTGSACIMQLWENENGDFEQVNASLPLSRGGHVDGADYDQDGDLDILHYGFNGSAYVTQVFRNAGNNTWVDINEPLLCGVGSAAAWGDYDNDGDPDLLVSAQAAGGSILTRVYRNDSPLPESSPAAPANVQANWDNGNLVFTWAAVTTDTHGNPLTPDYYELLGSTTPYDEASFRILDTTANLSFTLAISAAEGNSMFYKVRAHQEDSR
jgi:hypothetical protein